jgi:hypothetical protein
MNMRFARGKFWYDTINENILYDIIYDNRILLEHKEIWKSIKGKPTL